MDQPPNGLKSRGVDKEIQRGAETSVGTATTNQQADLAGFAVSTGILN